MKAALLLFGLSAATAHAEGISVAADAGMVKFFGDGPLGLGTTVFLGHAVGDGAAVDLGAGVVHGAQSTRGFEGVHTTLTLMPLLVGGRYQMTGDSTVPFVAVQGGLAAVRVGSDARDFEGATDSFTFWDAAFRIALGADYRLNERAAMGISLCFLLVATAGPTERGQVDTNVKVLQLGLSARYGG